MVTKGVKKAKSMAFNSMGNRLGNKSSSQAPAISIKQAINRIDFHSPKRDENTYKSFSGEDHPFLKKIGVLNAKATSQKGSTKRSSEGRTSPARFLNSLSKQKEQVQLPERRKTEMFRKEAGSPVSFEPKIPVLNFGALSHGGRTDEDAKSQKSVEPVRTIQSRESRRYLGSHNIKLSVDEQGKIFTPPKPTKLRFGSRLDSSIIKIVEKESTAKTKSPKYRYNIVKSPH